MFGGVPTGVAMPPSDAAMPTMSSRARGDSVEPAAASARTRPSAMGSIMAAVAVLLIHIEMPAVTRPTAMRSRTGDAATPGAARMASAMRRSRPWTRSASARRNEPRKRKMTGSPKGANASRALEMWSSTAERGPEQRRDGKRHRLADPEDHHQGHDRGQAVRVDGEGQRAGAGRPRRPAAPATARCGFAWRRARSRRRYPASCPVSLRCDSSRSRAPAAVPWSAMDCPRCGAPGVTTPACPRCGVIVAKARPASREERIARWQQPRRPRPGEPSRERPGRVSRRVVRGGRDRGRAGLRRRPEVVTGSEQGGTRGALRAPRSRTSPPAPPPPAAAPVVYSPPPTAAEIKAEVQGLSDADRAAGRGAGPAPLARRGDDRVRRLGSGAAVRRPSRRAGAARPAGGGAPERRRRASDRGGTSRRAAAYLRRAAAVNPASARPAGRAGGDADRGRRLDGGGGGGPGGPRHRPPATRGIWQQPGLRAAAAGPQPRGGGGARARPSRSSDDASTRALLARVEKGLARRAGHDRAAARRTSTSATTATPTRTWGARSCARWSGTTRPWPAPSTTSRRTRSR